MLTSSEEWSEDRSELFVRESGEPMQFSIRICYEKPEVERMVRDCGGQMVRGKGGPYTIRLFPREERGFGKVGDFFSSQYIYDCVEQRKLLPLTQYRLNQRSRYDGSIDPIDILMGKHSWDECIRTEEKTDNEVSEFSNDDSSTSVEVQKRKRSKNRAPYTHNERKAILNYIINNRRYAEVKGRMLWEDMSKAKVCPGRTWQSLKQHYRTFIIDNLSQFKLPDKVAKQIYAPYCPTTQLQSGLYSEEELLSEDEKEKDKKSMEKNDGGKKSKTDETSQGSNKEHHDKRRSVKDGNDQKILNKGENPITRETSQGSTMEQYVKAADGSSQCEDENEEKESSGGISSNLEDCAKTADGKGKGENEPRTVNEIKQKESKEKNPRTSEVGKDSTTEQYAKAPDHEEQDGNQPKHVNENIQRESGGEKPKIKGTGPNNSEEQDAKTPENKGQGEKEEVMTVSGNKQKESVKDLCNKQENFLIEQESDVNCHPSVEEKQHPDVENWKDQTEESHASSAQTWKTYRNGTQEFDSVLTTEEFTCTAKVREMPKSIIRELEEDWSTESSLGVSIEDLNEMQKLIDDTLVTGKDDKVSPNICVNLPDTESDIIENLKSQDSEAVSNYSSIRKNDCTSVNAFSSDPASSAVEHYKIPDTNFISSFLTQNESDIQSEGSTDALSAEEGNSRPKRKGLHSGPRMQKKPRLRPPRNSKASSQKRASERNDAVLIFSGDESSSESEVLIQRSIPAVNRRRVSEQVEALKNQKIPHRVFENSNLPKQHPLGDSRSESDSSESEDSKTFNILFNDPVSGRDTLTGRYDRSYHPHKGITTGAARRSSHTGYKYLSNKKESYSIQEDMEILLFIVHHGAYHRVGGRELWQEMQQSEILPNRTWHSLKERFRKRIILRLYRYLQFGLTEEDLKMFQLHVPLKVEAEGNENKWRPYTHEEDTLIVNFISWNRRYSEVGGKAMWVLMRSSVPGLNNRTWLSLKERFRRHIVNHLQDFGLTDDELENFRNRDIKPVRRKKRISFRKPPIRKQKRNSKLIERLRYGKYQEKEMCTDDDVEEMSNESDSDNEKSRMSSKGKRRQEADGKSDKSHKKKREKRKSTKMTERSEKDSDDSLVWPSISGYMQPRKDISEDDIKKDDRTGSSQKNHKVIDESDESDTDTKRSQGFTYRKGLSSKGKRKPEAYGKSDKLHEAKHEKRKNTKITGKSTRASDDSLVSPSTSGYMQPRKDSSEGDTEKDDRMERSQKNHLKEFQKANSKRKLFNLNEMVELSPKTPFNRGNFGNWLCHWKSIKRKEIDPGLIEEEQGKKKSRKETNFKSSEEENANTLVEGSNGDKRIAVPPLQDLEVAKEAQDSQTQCSESEENRSVSIMKEIHEVDSEGDEEGEKSVSKNIDKNADSVLDSCESKKANSSGPPSPESKILASEDENHESTTEVDVTPEPDEQEHSPSCLTNVKAKSLRNVILSGSKSSSGSLVDVVNVLGTYEKHNIVSDLVSETNIEVSRHVSAQDEVSPERIITKHSSEPARCITRNKIRKKIVHRRK